LWSVYMGKGIKQAFLPIKKTFMDNPDQHPLNQLFPATKTAIVACVEKLARVVGNSQVSPRIHIASMEKWNSDTEFTNFAFDVHRNSRVAIPIRDGRITGLDAGVDPQLLVLSLKTVEDEETEPGEKRHRGPAERKCPNVLFNKALQTAQQCRCPKSCLMCCQEVKECLSMDAITDEEYPFEKDFSCPVFAPLRYDVIPACSPNIVQQFVETLGASVGSLYLSEHRNIFSSHVLTRGCRDFDVVLRIGTPMFPCNHVAASKIHPLFDIVHMRNSANPDLQDGMVTRWQVFHDLIFGGSLDRDQHHPQANAGWNKSPTRKLGKHIWHAFNQMQQHITEDNESSRKKRNALAMHSPMFEVCEHLCHHARTSPGTGKALVTPLSGEHTPTNRTGFVGSTCTLPSVSLKHSLLPATHDPSLPPNLCPLHSPVPKIVSSHLFWVPT